MPSASSNYHNFKVVTAAFTTYCGLKVSDIFINIIHRCNERYSGDDYPAFTIKHPHLVFHCSRRRFNAHYKVSPGCELQTQLYQVAAVITAPDTLQTIILPVQHDATADPQIGACHSLSFFLFFFPICSRKHITWFITKLL